MVVGTPSLFVFAGILSLAASESMSRVLQDPSWTALLAAIFAVPVSAPANALTIGRSGGSLGKWIFSVKVVGPHRRPIGFRRALVRELDVWTRGIGLSLPLVSLITMLKAYGKLSEGGRTAWDKTQNNTILHRRWGPRDQLIGALVVGALIALSVLGRLSG